MQVENLIEIFAGADDGSNNGDPIQDRFEDGDAHRIVRRERHEHQGALAAQRSERLLERSR